MRFCSVASHVRINPGSHPLEPAAPSRVTHRASAHGPSEDEPGFFARRRARRVALGPDARVGHGAVPLPGVSVGAGAAIGAGAVVAKDVPPFAVAAGDPARVPRPRFAEKTRAALLRLARWD